MKKIYNTDKEKHIGTFLRNSRHRSKSKNLPFDLTFDYLISITTDECPVFKTPFKWGTNRGHKGCAPNNSPSLDKIIPELGYVQGNVAFISRRANKMKDDGTMQEHYAIADWIWEQTHAKKNSTTPVSTGNHIPGAVGAELGSVSTPWTWEDSDDTDDYRGTTQGHNAYRSAKEGG
jgi:hypothetical protein